MAVARRPGSPHRKLFGASDDIYQRCTDLSGAVEEVVDNAAVPKMEGWQLEKLDFGR